MYLKPSMLTVFCWPEPPRPMSTLLHGHGHIVSPGAQPGLVPHTLPAWQQTRVKIRSAGNWDQALKYWYERVWWVSYVDCKFAESCILSFSWQLLLNSFISCGFNADAKQNSKLNFCQRRIYQTQMRFRSFGNMLQNFFLFWFLSQTKKSFCDPEIVRNLESLDIEFKSNFEKFTFIKI